MRLAASALVLLLVLGGAGALAAWGWQRAEGATATYRVEALGPEGPILAEEVVVENATVLRALEAAAARAGFALDVERYPGMGAYVRAIGPWEAGGPAGWVYEVHRDGAWVSGDRSAERFALQKGDAVRWSWTAG